MAPPSKRLKACSRPCRLPNEEIKARFAIRQTVLADQKTAAKVAEDKRKEAEEKEEEELRLSARTKYSSAKQRLTMHNLGSSIKMYSTNIEVPNGSKYDLKMGTYLFEDIVDFKTVLFITSEHSWYRCHLVFVKPKDEIRDFEDLPETIQNQIVEMLSLAPNEFKSIRIKSYKGLVEAEQDLMETGDVYQTIIPQPDLIANLEKGIRSGKVLATFHAWPVNAWNFCAASQIEILNKYVYQNFTSKVCTVDLHNYEDLTDTDRAPRWVHYYYNWAAFMLNFFQVGMAHAIGFQEADITCQMNGPVIGRWCNAKSGFFLLDSNENRDSLYVNYELGVKSGSHVYLNFPPTARKHMLRLDMGKDTYVTFDQFQKIVSLKPNKDDHVFKSFKKEMMKSGCRVVATIVPEFVPTNEQLANMPAKDRPLRRCEIMITEEKQCKAMLQMGEENIKRAHYKASHLSLKVQCKQCFVVNLFWEEFNDLINHENAQHNSQNTFVCGNCNIRFGEKGKLKRHTDAGVCKKKEKVPVVLLVVDPRHPPRSPIPSGSKPTRRLPLSPTSSEASDYCSDAIRSPSVAPPSPTYSEIEIRYPSVFSPSDITPSLPTMSTLSSIISHPTEEQHEIIESVIHNLLDKVVATDASVLTFINGVPVFSGGEMESVLTKDSHDIAFTLVSGKLSQPHLVTGSEQPTLDKVMTAGNVGDLDVQV